MEMSKEYIQAKKQVREIKDFYLHFIIYISVIALLLIVDISDGGNWWCYWPAIGWGIFILMNLYFTKSHGTFSYGWEERKIQEIIERG